MQLSEHKRGDVIHFRIGGQNGRKYALRLSESPHPTSLEGCWMVCGTVVLKDGSPDKRYSGEMGFYVKESELEED